MLWKDVYNASLGLKKLKVLRYVAFNLIVKMSYCKVDEKASDRARRYLIDAYSFPDRKILNVIVSMVSIPARHLINVQTLMAESRGLGSYIPEKYHRHLPFWFLYLFSARTVYYAYTSSIFRVLIFAALLGHIILSFYEAPGMCDSVVNKVSDTLIFANRVRR
jgi:hypothetical protein